MSVSCFEHRLFHQYNMLSAHSDKTGRSNLGPRMRVSVAGAGRPDTHRGGIGVIADELDDDGHELNGRLAVIQLPFEGRPFMDAKSLSSLGLGQSEHETPSLNLFTHGWRRCIKNAGAAAT